MLSLSEVFHDWEGGNKKIDGVNGSMTRTLSGTLEKVEVFTDDLDGFSRT